MKRTPAAFIENLAAACEDVFSMLLYYTSVSRINLQVELIR